MLEDVTFGIKTFLRPRKLGRLITSIREEYPHSTIAVADDSLIAIPRKDVHYHILPFNSGISAGRNLLVDHTQTEFFVTLDDDFLFCNQTDIDTLRVVVQQTDVDIAAGTLWEVDGFWRGGGILEFRNGALHKHNEYYEDRFLLYRNTQIHFQIVDYVHNFFLAKTTTLKELRWDENLKLKEL